MPDTAKTAVRSRDDLTTARERLQVQHAARLADPGGYDPGDSYTAGQLAALGWVLGQEPAPMTGQDDVDLTNPYAIDRERILATEMLYGRAELDRRGRDYVVGVESALMWVRNQTDSPL